MDNCFYLLEGTKKLILRKEGNQYVTFNPVKLEFYSINLIGAEILFLISKQYTKEEIIRKMTQKYQISTQQFSNDIDKFLLSFGCFDIIRESIEPLGFKF